MSYDLAVFDPSAAPRTDAGFTEWYRSQTEFEETHNYDDPAVSTPSLRAWFNDMLKEFPAMNGPYARADGGDDSRVSDYAVGRFMIYVGFAWSKAAEAYQACYRLAAKHGVGFIDVSGDHGDVWFPNGAHEGGLVRAFSLLPDA